jgi:multiple sugar transport system substrate-binding protein
MPVDSAQSTWPGFLNRQREDETMMTLNRRALLGHAAAAALVSAFPMRVLAAAPLPNVTIWVQSGPEADALTAVAAAYTKATGNPVSVVRQGRADWNRYYETALAAGSRDFDGVLHISRFVPALAAAGLLARLDDYIAASPDYDLADIPGIVQEEMKYDKHWYMAPTDITLETLIYRKDLIATPPKTWAELRDNALKFTQSLNKGSPTRYGYAYAASPGTVMGTFLGIMGSYGANFVDPKGCVTTDTPEMLAAWTFFINLKNVDHVTSPDINTWDYPELLAGLQNGTVAQASFFSSGMPVLSDCSQTSKCQDFALVAQPAGPKGSKTRVNPLGIMVNAASENKDATWAFLRFATGKEGAAIYTKAGGQSPRLSVLGDASIAASRPWTPEIIKASKDGVGTLRIAKSQEVSEAFNRFADQAIAGQLSPEESLKQASAAIRQLLDQNSCK